MIADQLNTALNNSPFSAGMRSGRLVLTLDGGASATLEQMREAQRILQRSRLGAETFVAVAERNDISLEELHRALAAEGLPVVGVSRRGEYKGLTIIQARPGSSNEQLAALAARAAVAEALPPPEPPREQLEEEAIQLEKDLVALNSLEGRGADVSARKAQVESRLAVLALKLADPPGVSP